MPLSRRCTTSTAVIEGVRGRAGWPVRGIWVLLATLVGAIGWPVAAHAHTELVGSSPTHGARVSLSTDRLVLEFSDDLLPVGHDVVVRDADGDDVTTGHPAPSGSSLAVQLDLAMPGRHTVSYRVVGQDGHAIAGELWFTAAADGRPRPTTVAAASGDAPRATTAVARGVPESSPDGSASSLWLLPSVGLVGLLVLLHRACRAARPAPGGRDGP